jgi:hypothetical protein
MIYEQLKNYKVRNTCTCKEGCDVSEQFTKTQDSSMAKQLSQPLQPLQHYRLVLSEIGRSLNDFRNTKEMVTALRDAIIGMCIGLSTELPLIPFRQPMGTLMTRLKFLAEISAQAIFLSLPQAADC